MNKIDEKGKEYLLVYYYTELSFNEFIGHPPWVDIKSESMIRFTK